MKLKYVTITGADDSISPKELVPLTRRFPFVEWAILFSKAKQGQPRYPSAVWVEDLRDVMYDELDANRCGMNISCHICGEWTREILAGKFEPDAISNLLKTTDRIQINMTDEDYMALDFGKLQQTVMNAYSKEQLTVDVEPNGAILSQFQVSTAPDVILQTKRSFVRYEWLALLNKNVSSFDFQLLYDVSGGKGVSPRSWCSPVEGVMCGYAGGLKPDNIKEQLEKLEKVVYNNEVWIDMESGVRGVNDKFDLGRVEEVLEIASKWVLDGESQIA